MWASLERGNFISLVALCKLIVVDPAVLRWKIDLMRIEINWAHIQSRSCTMKIYRLSNPVECEALGKG